MRREKGIKVKVDISKCTGCAMCVDACPMGAISIDKVAKIDASLCAGCCVCMDECPNDAIYKEMKDAASSIMEYASPSPSHRPVTGFAKPISASRNFVSQLGVKQVNKGDGFLNHIFDFFGRTANSGRSQGCGQGKGCGGGRGGGRYARRS